MRVHELFHGDADKSLVQETKREQCPEPNPTTIKLDVSFRMLVTFYKSSFLWYVLTLTAYNHVAEFKLLSLKPCFDKKKISIFVEIYLFHFNFYLTRKLLVETCFYLMKKNSILSICIICLSVC